MAKVTKSFYHAPPIYKLFYFPSLRFVIFQQLKRIINPNLIKTFLRNIEKKYMSYEILRKNLGAEERQTGNRMLLKKL